MQAKAYVDYRVMRRHKRTMHAREARLHQYGIGLDALKGGDDASGGFKGGQQNKASFLHTLPCLRRGLNEQGVIAGRQRVPPKLKVRHSLEPGCYISR